VLFLKHKKPLKISMETDPRIRLHPGGFYPSEVPDSPTHKLYCLRPWDEDDDVEFPDLAMESAARMLRDFPTVVNQLSYVSAQPKINDEPFVQHYLRMGGKPTFVGKRTLITVTAGADRRLLDCIPVNARWCEELECCGFTGDLPVDFVYNYPAQFGQYLYALKVYFHEDHDYLLFETGRDPEPYIEQICQICEKHGRILTRFDH
jgi:hypothetical protein